jgi:hypothetical protein
VAIISFVNNCCCSWGLGLGSKSGCQLVVMVKSVVNQFFVVNLWSLVEVGGIRVKVTK